MYCKKCGNELEEDSRFCSVCGWQIIREPENSLDEKDYEGEDSGGMSFTRAVLLAKEGKDEGIQYLYNCTYKNQYYIALKYMRDEEAAIDVLQDSYVKAFAKLDTLREPEKFPNWLGRIVANTALNVLKAQKRRNKNELLFSQLESENDEGEMLEYQIEDDSKVRQPEIAYTQQETQKLVRELIDDLPIDQKMCILLFHIEGNSIKEIAETMDCSENTVKSRLNYGRKNIKEKAEELQKKGVKIYSAAPITLLVYLLRTEAEAFTLPESAKNATTLAGSKLLKTQTAGQPIGEKNSEIVGKEAGKELGKTAGKTFFKTATGKITAIVATVAVIGGVAAVVLNLQKPEETAVVEQTTTATTEITTVVTTEEVTTEEEKSEEDIYYAYLQDTLAGELDMAQLQQSGEIEPMSEWETVEIDALSSQSVANDWMKVSGIISADIYDYDQDGVKEMLVVYDESRVSDGTAECNDVLEGKEYSQMMMRMYAIEDSQVVLKDTKEVSAYCENNSQDNYKGPAKVMHETNEWADVTFRMERTVADGKCYLVFYCKQLWLGFGNGSFLKSWVMEYADGNISYVKSFMQDGLGSEVGDYLYYDFENGERMDVYFVPPYGEYPFGEYLQELGIGTDEEGRLTEEQVYRIMDYSVKCELSLDELGSMSPFDGPARPFSLNITDGTGLREHISE